MTTGETVNTQHSLRATASLCLARHGALELTPFSSLVGWCKGAVGMVQGWESVWCRCLTSIEGLVQGWESVC